MGDSEHLRGAAAPAVGVRTPASARRRAPLDRRHTLVGLAGGGLSGLLGVGGGVIMVPLLVLFGRYGQREAHALSLGAIIPIGVVGVATYGAAGEVRVVHAGALALGAVVGASWGVQLLVRADERLLKGAFGLFLLAVAAVMVLRR